jgi:hypothetical protein
MNNELHYCTHTHTHTHTLALIFTFTCTLTLTHYTPLPPHRPTEFLPLEYSGIRGIEQKMYKEQEILKMKNHKDIKASYNSHCSKLPTYETVFFPARVSPLYSAK